MQFCQFNIYGKTFTFMCWLRNTFEGSFLSKVAELKPATLLKIDFFDGVFQLF